MEENGQNEMKNPFMELTGVRVAEVSPEGARLAVTLGPEHLNPIGLAHGGVLFTLADCAAGYAARADGRAYVTQNANLNFLRSAKSGTLYGVSRVIHRGRTVVLLRVDILDEAGRLLAQGNVTMFCIGPA